MAKVTAVKALNDFFNKDENGKSIKPVSEFNNELKALSPDEKSELGELAAQAMGNTTRA